MKTEALIAMLARGPVRVAPGTVVRRLLGASAAGVALALIVVLAGLGVRADIAEAARLPMFWGKLAVPLVVVVLSMAAASRLARPDGTARRATAVGAMLLAVLWASAAAEVATAPAADRPTLVVGTSALPCVVLIAALSLPLLVALFVALRSLAPTRLPAAGAASGALAGGLAAAAYALHCDEMTLPFVAAWYVLGMAIPAALGALLAPRWLRWS